MKRIVVLLAVTGLLVGAVTTAEAGKKKKKKAKAVKTTLYFHGTDAAGEVDMINGFGTAYQTMDRTKPAAGAPKSRQFTTWSGNPQMWNECAGSYLLPVWAGNVSGRIVGDMKVTLHTASAPRQVTVQVWPDLMTQTCNSNDLSQGEYPKPAAEATVTLPAGPGKSTVTLKKVNFKAVGRLTLQLLPQGPVPGRVLYDSADFASSITFSCVPSSGKSCS